MSLEKLRCFLERLGLAETMSYLQSVTGSIASSPGPKHICWQRSHACCVIAHRARTGVRALWIEWRKGENETFFGLIKITLWLEIKVDFYGNVKLVNFPLIMRIDIYLWRLSCGGLLKHHLLYSLIAKCELFRKKIDNGAKQQGF